MKQINLDQTDVKVLYVSWSQKHGSVNGEINDIIEGTVKLDYVNENEYSERVFNAFIFSFIKSVAACFFCNNSADIKCIIIICTEEQKNTTNVDYGNFKRAALEKLYIHARLN